MSNPRLPFIRALEADLNGWAFFLCTQKEMRQGRTGEPFISLMLQDKTGFIKGRVLNDAVRLRDEFDSGEFVKVQARTDVSNGRLQLVVERIRRINPDQDAQQGFREEDCVMCAARPVEEMWDELQELVAHVQDPFVRELLLSETSRRRGIFDARYIERLLVRHANGRPLDWQLWMLIVFEMWCRSVLDRRGASESCDRRGGLGAFRDAASVGGGRQGPPIAVGREP